jgi:hypothetical protein
VQDNPILFLVTVEMMFAFTIIFHLFGGDRKPQP